MNPTEFFDRLNDKVRERLQERRKKLGINIPICSSDINLCMLNIVDQIVDLEFGDNIDDLTPISEIMKCIEGLADE